jgi:hypothetical protein
MLSWSGWLEENFPDIGASTVYRYMNLAKHRELLENLSRVGEVATLKEAERLIHFHERRKSNRHHCRPMLIRLKNLKLNFRPTLSACGNCAIKETEIFGMFQALELSNDQI